MIRTYHEFYCHGCGFTKKAGKISDLPIGCPACRDGKDTKWETPDHYNFDGEVVPLQFFRKIGVEKDGEMIIPKHGTLHFNGEKIPIKAGDKMTLTRDTWEVHRNGEFLGVAKDIRERT